MSGSSPAALEAELRLVCTRCRGIYRARFERCPRDGASLEPLGKDPLEGAVLHDRYIVEGCIGEGAMGRVYRARHTRMSKRFAVKVLFGDLAADARMRARFAREAEAASRLDHPNVVRVVDFAGENSGLLYLVMDYIEGENLADVIAAEAPFSSDRVVRLARELAAGLGHAHERGTVHRDFKAENVVVVVDGGKETPKIIDFGVASVERETDSRLTQTGHVVGTPAYMSPEQAAGLEVDHRTDLFALGLLMYEMLAGRSPFDGTPVEIARLNATAPIPPIALRGKVMVDSRLEAIVQRLLAKQRQDRFASAPELIAALDRLRLTSGPHLAPRPASRATTPFTPPETTAPPRMVRIEPRRRQATSDGLEAIALPAKKAWRGPLYLTFTLGAVAATVLLIGRAELERREEPAATALEQPEPVETESPGVEPSKRKIKKRRVPLQPKDEIAAAAEPQPPEIEPEKTVRKPFQEAEPSSDGPSIELVSERYIAVGGAIDRFLIARGRAAGQPFVQRYQELDAAYREALRFEELRSGFIRELDGLAADLKRAEKPQ